MDNILVIGGYGDVGKQVIKELLAITSENIIIGGRSENKAKQFIIKSNTSRLHSLPIDIYKKSSYVDTMEKIKIVIMCLSPHNNEFAKHCLEKGIHYIDISASSETIKKMEGFDNLCKKRNATCVLGVGICPGLSTLLVKDIVQNFNSVEKTEISLMLSSGDNYGKDALQWLLTNLSHPFTWVHNQTLTRQKAFIEETRAKFPPSIGERSTYAFNLADQQIVSHTLSLSNVRTYFCYDSKASSWLVHLLSKMGFFKLAKYKLINKLMMKFLRVLSTLFKPFSSDVFAINIKISGCENEYRTTRIKNIVGNNSAMVTGKIVAQTAAKLIKEDHKPGVFYLNQLFSLDDYSAQNNYVISEETRRDKP